MYTIILSTTKGWAVEGCPPIVTYHWYMYWYMYSCVYWHVQSKLCNKVGQIRSRGVLYTKNTPKIQIQGIQKIHKIYRKNTSQGQETNTQKVYQKYKMD